MYSISSTFYKIPKPKLLNEYTFSEIQEMFIDIVYYRKQEKKSTEN